MPRAFTQNYYHTVFSTCDRVEFIDPAIEARLYPFMGGIVRDLGGSMLAINGMPDHVHLLVRYPSDLSHADMLRHLKSRSSKWVHQTFPTMGQFAWQEGYGGFTVSRSVVPAVEAYIAGQKEHHKKQGFKEELLALLWLHGVEFDEAEVFE